MTANEPVTTDDRIFFIDHNGTLQVFDRRGHCAACRRCLVNRWDRCPWGGPFDARLQLNPQAWVAEKRPLSPGA